MSRSWWLVVAVLGLTLGVSLGGSSRLSYHEAFVAQAAREMLADGDWVVPHVDGRPWLEKPPLLIWCVAALGALAGGVSETVARLPSALAASGLVMIVADVARRRWGPRMGLLAALFQATTSWLVLRGRLAEADMALAFLVSATLWAFDRLREVCQRENVIDHRVKHVLAWAVFGLLGATSLAKGIGFGALLGGSAMAATLLWDRDGRTLRALVRRLGPGVLLASALGLAWPLLALARHPGAWSLWTLHVADRFAESPEHFAGARPWWFYGPAILSQALPWAPLAILGAWESLSRASMRAGRFGLDRFLWCWALAPVVLLSLATVKNSHYAIAAMPPWSCWAALGAWRLSGLLERRGDGVAVLKRRAFVLFGGVAVAWALAFAVFLPRLDRRGHEWAFYEAAGKRVSPGMALTLVYDDWDRLPYPTPFGPFPHDLAVRLFYLERPATWTPDPSALPRREGTPIALIARDRDIPILERLGRLETLASGPTLRASRSKVDDRTFRLFQLTPDPSPRDPALTPARLTR